MKPLYTDTGLLIAKDFLRIEHGGRGDYFEISPEKIVKENIFIPEDKKWKFEEIKKNPKNPCVDYIEFRSKRDNVKIYFQINTQYVDYAEYKPGFYYISTIDVSTINHSLMKFLEV